MNELYRTYSIVNKSRFLNICDQQNRLQSGDDDTSGIGTLNEKRMHGVLKRYFDDDISHHEIHFLGYVADIMNETGIVEIQTSSLVPLYYKLGAFLPETHVTLVHPLIYNKTVSWIEPENGDISKGRKSPVHETFTDGMIELYNIRSHLSSKNLSIRFVSLDVDEYRYRDGWGRGGKRGSHRYECIPICLNDIYCIDGKDDYLQFLPEALRGEDGFISSEYESAMRLHRNDAYRLIKVLEFAGIVENAGKKGRYILYKYIK